jgi:SAM-dependent methyltransferase
MNKIGNYNDLPILAELYDLVPGYLNRTDRQFYVNLCQEIDGDILELGSGTGRILIPIAKKGYKITGLDLSENMLSVCRKKLSKYDDNIQNNVTLVQGSMTNFDLGKKFDLITIPFRAFQHLIERENQESGLRCVHKHLKDNGRLVFDVFHVDFNQIHNPKFKEESEDTPEFELENGFRLRRCNRVVEFHIEEQYNDVELIYYLTDKNGDTERFVHQFLMRYFLKVEIEQLLERCKLQVIEIFGNFDKSPLTEKSPEMIIVAEKKSG